MAKYKKCINCNKRLPVTVEHFYKNKGSKDGFRNDCKKCVSQKTSERSRKRREKGLHLIHELNCNWCKKDFKGDTKDRRFCSVYCQFEWQRDNPDVFDIKNGDLTEIKCKNCGEIFSRDYLTQKYCSYRCAESHRRVKTKAMRRLLLERNPKTDWTISLELLRKRDGDTCYICGEQCNEDDYSISKDGHFIVGEAYPSIDHVKPLSKGGDHSWDNVKLAHHRCNMVKGAFTLENT